MVGPVVLAQVIPLTPIIDHVPVPVGVAPPVAPATVAVKVKVEPSATVEALVVTLTLGVAWAMTNGKAVEGPAEV